MEGAIFDSNFKSLGELEAKNRNLFVNSLGISSRIRFCDFYFQRWQRFSRKSPATTESTRRKRSARKLALSTPPGPLLQRLDACRAPTTATRRRPSSLFPYRARGPYVRDGKSMEGTDAGVRTGAASAARRRNPSAAHALSCVPTAKRNPTRTPSETKESLLSGRTRSDNPLDRICRAIGSRADVKSENRKGSKNRGEKKCRYRVKTY